MKGGNVLGRRGLKIRERGPGCPAKGDRARGRPCKRGRMPVHRAYGVLGLTEVRAGLGAQQGPSNTPSERQASEGEERADEKNRQGRAVQGQRDGENWSSAATRRQTQRAPGGRRGGSEFRRGVPSRKGE